MINSGPQTVEEQAAEQEAVRRIVGAGAGGAVAVAGAATAIVIAIWLIFYLLIFIPRTTGSLGP
ncbi:MAG: hypothetical protein JO227_02760 [Acetobacteraceae bacterium]|nr:hypothetical protein [Acetobacteraceae bacterium]